MPKNRQLVLTGEFWGFVELMSCDMAPAKPLAALIRRSLSLLSNKADMFLVPAATWEILPVKL